MALIVSVVHGHDSAVTANLRATLPALVTQVSGSEFTYVYDGCRGTAAANPRPAVGSRIPVFYNPDVPCDNLTFDPSKQESSDLAWLLAAALVVPLAAGSAAWDAARSLSPRRSA